MRIENSQCETMRLVSSIRRIRNERFVLSNPESLPFTSKIPRGRVVVVTPSEASALQPTCRTPNEIDGMIAQRTRVFGGVDILVCNAGIHRAAP